MIEKIVNVEAIIKYIKDNKLSKTKFCKMCKVCKETMNKILSGKTNFNAIALFKIARVMNIELYKIFNPKVS